MENSSDLSILRIPPPQVTMPVLAILGYTAFLMTGFNGPGNGLGEFRPLPLYLFLSILLLALQAIIAYQHSMSRLIYLFTTSTLALFYAASVIFFSSDIGKFTHDPLFYALLEIVLVCVFLYDAVDRRRVVKRPLDGSSSNIQLIQRYPQHPFSLNEFATDFTGLAVLAFISWGLLSFLGNCNFASTATNSLAAGLTAFPICGSGAPYVNFASLPLPLPLPTTLPSLNTAIGFGALGVTLLLYGIVGMIAVVLSARHTREETPTGWDSFRKELIKITGESLNEVLLSLRLALSPLVWLIPAFSIANFSRQFTTYLAIKGNEICSNTGDCVKKLFNPFNSFGDYGQALNDLALGIIAVGAVILAVAVVEHNGIVIRRALSVLSLAGRTVALTLVFFFLSLSSINAFIVFFNRATPVIPFQVGTSTMLAAFAAIGFIVYDTILTRRMHGD